MFNGIEYGGIIKGAYKFVEDPQDPSSIALEDLTVHPEQAWNRTDLMKPQIFKKPCLSFHILDHNLIRYLKT